MQRRDFLKMAGLAAPQQPAGRAATIFLAPAGPEDVAKTDFNLADRRR